MLAHIIDHSLRGEGTLTATQYQSGIVAATPAARLRSVLARISGTITWRRVGFVLLLCLIFSTQLLSRPDLFENWSLERIVEGWSYYFAEVAATGLAMFGGFALADSISSEDGPRRAIAVGIALPLSAALGYALAVAILYSPGFPILSMQFVGDTLRFAVVGGGVASIHMLRRPVR
jgi:hypothetical protein